MEGHQLIMDHHPDLAVLSFIQSYMYGRFYTKFAGRIKSLEMDSR